MKKILLFLAVMMLAISCTAPIPEIITEPEAEPTTESVVELADQLSDFVGTKAAEPLECTIWEHATGDKINKYILFRDGMFQLFYGAVYDDELERYSDFYASPYEFVGDTILTGLLYPQWGSQECTECITVAKIEGVYTFVIDIYGSAYYYFGNDTSTIEEKVTLFYIGIEPWS